MRLRRLAPWALLVGALGSTLGCNEGPPTATTAPAVLEVGTPVTISGARGSRRTYRVTVPEGSGKLRILMGVGSGDADMAVRFGAAPEPTAADCTSESEFPVEECVFDAPAAGVWYVMVIGYSDYDAAELSADLLPQVGERLLSSGVATSGLSGLSGRFEMFRLTVPSGTDSLVVALEATGDVDLYLDFARYPRLNDFACASFTDSGSERCVILAPTAGTWMIRVDAYLDFRDGTLTATSFPAAP